MTFDGIIIEIERATVKIAWRYGEFKATPDKTQWFQLFMSGRSWYTFYTNHVCRILVQNGVDQKLSKNS